MKRLCSVAAAALVTICSPLRADGPDDKYIEVYKLIQEGDQLVAAGRSDSARQRYSQAHTDLKSLQTTFPNWNEKLVEFRMRILESKLGALVGKGTESSAPVKTEVSKEGVATKAQPQMPAPVAPTTLTPAAPVQVNPAPVVVTPPPARTVPQVDERDSQIKNLQQQVGNLQSERAILQAKLREALSAQPAALDPRELARAEERIRILEKEKEILNVSVQRAEARVSRKSETDNAEAKKALAQAQQRIVDQNEAINALRQEKSALEKRLQSARQADEDTIKNLRAENDNLKKQLASTSVGTEVVRSGDQGGKELSSTKAALQSSRDTVSSLQVRVRTLEEEKERLEKTRKELETKLASANTSNSKSSTGDAGQIKQLQKDRDDLQRRVTDLTRQLADTKAKIKQPRPSPASDELVSLRARLEILEAKKIPYSPEELALFKKPQEAAVVAKIGVEEKPAELSPAANTLMAEAQRAFSARRFDEAEKKYEEVLRMDDKNVATLQRLAAAQLEQNRLKEAEANLRRALDQKGEDPRSLLLMGIVKYEQEKFDDALENLSRSVQIDPVNPETQNYLGITLSQKGQRAAAETALRKAIQLSPNYASAHYNLAVVYVNQQPPFLELARWHYQKAQAFGHPQNPELEKMMERKQSAPSK